MIFGLARQIRADIASVQKPPARSGKRADMERAELRAYRREPIYVKVDSSLKRRGMAPQEER